MTLANFGSLIELTIYEVKNRIDHEWKIDWNFRDTWLECNFFKQCASR